MANYSIPHKGLALNSGSDFSLTADLPKAGTLFIGTGGNLRCQLGRHNVWLEFNNIPDGVDFPRYVTRIDPASTVDNVIVDL